MALTGTALLGAIATGSARLGPAGRLMAGCVLAALPLNLLLSAQPLQSARTAALLAGCVLIALFCAGLPGSDRLRAWRPEDPLTMAIVIAGTGLAIHGLHQALFVFGPGAQVAEALPEAVRARVESGRAVSTLGLPGALAGFLAMSAPLAVAWGRRRDLPIAARAAALAAAGVQGLGLIATRSAAPLAALAFGAALAAAPGARAASRAFSGRRLLAAAIAAAGLIGAASLLALRFASAGAADEGSGPLSLRAGNWKVAMAIFLSAPVLGAGAGCYGVLFPALREWGMNETRYAHNSYLQALAEGGLALGIPLVVCCVWLARLFIRRARQGEPEVAAAGLAFLAHNLVDFTFYLPTTAMTFAMLAGLAIGMEPDPAPRARGGPRPRALLALAVALFAVFVGRGDAARDEAADLAERGNLAQARQRAEVAVARNPVDPDARGLLSWLLLRENEAVRDPEALAEAETQALRAVDLDPRTPHRWHHLGRVRLARGDLLGAYLAIARAADLYPIRTDYRDERDALAEALGRRGGGGR